MRLVGLTGGVASGKSTVGRILREQLGVEVIDADQVSRDVVLPGQPALAALVTAFGPEILHQDGTLDRKGLRQRITTDPAAKARVEAITHPAIRGAIAERLMALAGQGVTVAVVEAALLVETGQYKGYPELIVVGCDPEEQIRRLTARDGVSEAQARAMLASQAPFAEKAAVATEVIVNDGDLTALTTKTHAAWASVLGRG